MEKKISKNYDLTKILRSFENKWVALTPDNKKVIASGDTLDETSSKVKNKDVIFMKVLSFHASYAPVTL